MPDREDFPLPEIIDPPTRRGICVPVPDDPVYMHVFAGLLQELTFWFNWQRDPLKRGKDAAHVWLEIFNNIDWQGGDCMGCCDDRIVMHRVTDGGAMEISTDGGDTWTPDPADPRINGTSLPNSIPGAGSQKKCNGATNAIGNFKDAQASFGHSLTSATTIIGLALAIAGELLVLLLSAGTLAEVIVPLVISTATALFGVAESSYNAEFTEAIWDDLTCAIFCNIGSDGQFTEAQLNDLEAQVDTDFTGNVALTFQSILRGWGVLGLNNACISGVAATADCSDCACDETCGVRYDVSDPYSSPSYGTITDRTDNTLDLEIGPTGYGVILAHDFHVCCYVNSVEHVSGSSSAAAFIPCGVAWAEGNYVFASPVGQCCATILSTGTPGAIIRFNFGDCP